VPRADVILDELPGQGLNRRRPGAGHVMAVEDQDEDATGRERLVAGDVLRDLLHRSRHDRGSSRKCNALECDELLRSTVLEHGDFTAGEVGDRLPVAILDQHGDFDDVDAGPESLGRRLCRLGRGSRTVRRRGCSDQQQ
jgi:hypothetical protein